ncbi:4-hydroxythreonine-4-phosphate dehydrogenase PdxA [Gloeocapsa sp. PCC 73106]|uniref:4-hydroxythreonine-4-phosphate dehydrogenase PdxA n=1 Tax=Gloeocapsa sp. PCC 73106 TaxID=102232 RepID=UPI0002AC5DF7|nr:4-hydroxythreonine-4-phosphate dehydrogenase PdxA [Gloeocapsa sp. PCC 73106]ELR96513.1 4-hydroxythreonine-4-phosphate dehydrogenase [Gloeocapsa sp. PCC 73106]
MTKSEQTSLVITMGDPAGIGPEIILQALSDRLSVTSSCQITVIGSLEVLKNTYQKLRNQVAIADPETIEVWDLPLDTPIEPGKGNAATGYASFAYLEKAIQATQEGKFQGIVTAPIAKSLWHSAGYNYPGQTEVLATRAGVDQYGMLFVGRSPYTGWILRTLLATTHIPLAEVPQTLNPQLMTNKLDLLINSLRQDFGITNPFIQVSGLNPHSGEGGKLGTEEQQWLIPWLNQESQRRNDVKLIGPVPPDTLWVKPAQAWYQSVNHLDVADAYLALYHDQGLIPVKIMAFAQAVNTTIGLPFVRTSPDHGTAFDLAGSGLADASSIKAAIEWAFTIVTRLNRSKTE